MIPPKPEPPANRTIRESLPVWPVALVVGLVIGCAAGAGLTMVATQRELAAADALTDQATAAFNQCAEDYGRLADGLRSLTRKP